METFFQILNYDSKITAERWIFKKLNKFNSENNVISQKEMIFSFVLANMYRSPECPSSQLNQISDSTEFK